MSKDDSRAERAHQVELRREFYRGYACAVATLKRLEGSDSTDVKELLNAVGLTSRQNCVDVGVDDFDVNILFPKGKKK